MSLTQDLVGCLCADRFLPQYLQCSYDSKTPGVYPPRLGTVASGCVFRTSPYAACTGVLYALLVSMVGSSEVIDLARQHVHSCRYIDDFLTWSCDPPPASLYSMDYTDTSNNIDDVSYIGIRIRIEITTEALPFPPHSSW